MFLTKNKIKPKSFESRRMTLFLPGVDAPHVYVTACLGARLLLKSYQTPSTGLRHPSLEEGAGKRCSEGA